MAARAHGQPVLLSERERLAASAARAALLLLAPGARCPCAADAAHRQCDGPRPAAAEARGRRGGRPLAAVQRRQQRHGGADGAGLLTGAAPPEPREASIETDDAPAVP